MKNQIKLLQIAFLFLAVVVMFLCYVIFQQQESINNINDFFLMLNQLLNGGTDI